MVQPGFGGVLDTPRTNLGDATYLDTQPDLDISPEATFISPAKDDLLGQLRNGRSRSANFKTPRSRGPFNDRRNILPNGGGGGPKEFTPLFKSAVKGSSRRGGKENGTAVPSTPTLNRIEEDLTPVPLSADASRFGNNNNNTTQVDASSVMSSPIAPPPRRDTSGSKKGGGSNGPLNNGKQLSLREQEDVIDKIEKENFGLKLKIHFLEDALRKSGPGSSEAALKENTELKVDQVTMKRELSRYKKQLTSAERDLENYRQQLMDLDDKVKNKNVDENQRAEMEKLQQILEDKDADIENLERQLERGQGNQEELEKLHDDIADLEADVREKDRIIGEREDEAELLRDKVDDAEDQAKELQRRVIELEELLQKQQQNQGSSSRELGEAKKTISLLEDNNRRLEKQLQDMTKKFDEAVASKDRAEHDLENLQDDLANKSVVNKGIFQQRDEKITRLQNELNQATLDYETLERQFAEAETESSQLKAKLKAEQHERQVLEQNRHILDSASESEIDKLKQDLRAQSDDLDLLRSRNDTLATQSSTLQTEIAGLEKTIERLEDDLDQERNHALELEKHAHQQSQVEIDRLNDEISDLQAEIREKDNMYDNDSEKWELEHQKLESERDRAEEKAAGLQRTIDKLRESEGALSSKESRLQNAMQSETERHRSEEAVLSRQIDDLQQALESRQAILTELRNEVSAVRDSLRQKNLDYQAQADKVQALEDEVEVLQSSLDDDSEQSRRELERARKESNDLRRQLETLRKTSLSPSKGNHASSEAMVRLESQLSDLTSQLVKANKEKQSLQDKLSAVSLDLQSLRSLQAETKAEKEELEDEIRRSKQHEEHTYRIDQERIDLRTSKVKLDSEVRRLRDENAAMLEERMTLERTLEDEIARATDEEERLSQEIATLQAKARQSNSSESHELVSSRRNIRELERQVKDLEAQLAATTVELQQQGSGEGNSELSMVRRDLNAARNKELEYLQHESTHKEAIRGFKKQIASLERQLHEAEISRLMHSPEKPTLLSKDADNAVESPSVSSRRLAEINDLRRQITSSQQSIQELRNKLREAERKSSREIASLQRQLDDVSDERLALEQALEDANLDAEDIAAQHESETKRLQLKLEKAERDGKAALATSKRQQLQQQQAQKSTDEVRGLQELLEQSQAETEALEHDIMQQQEQLDALAASETSLRRKLERARSERAAYRVSAEKLQRDMKEAEKVALQMQQEYQQQISQQQQQQQKQQVTAPIVVTKKMVAANVGAARSGSNSNSTPTAHDVDRHAKELRGMVMQMDWMQARWEREAKLRADAAFAKKFLQLQLEVANACNNAQLRELEQIRQEVLGSQKPLVAANGGTLSSGRSKKKTAAFSANGNNNSSSSSSSSSKSAETARRRLRIACAAVRFVVRSRRAATDWATHEATRVKLARCADDMKKQRRASEMQAARVVTRPKPLTRA